jgi:hypothetical protein
VSDLRDAINEAFHDAICDGDGRGDADHLVHHLGKRGLVIVETVAVPDDLLGIPRFLMSCHPGGTMTGVGCKACGKPITTSYYGTWSSGPFCSPDCYAPTEKSALERAIAEIDALRIDGSGEYNEGLESAKRVLRRATGAQ